MEIFATAGKVYTKTYVCMRHAEKCEIRKRIVVIKLCFSTLSKFQNFTTSQRYKILCISLSIVQWKHKSSKIFKMARISKYLRTNCICYIISTLKVHLYMQFIFFYFSYYSRGILKLSDIGIGSIVTQTSSTDLWRSSYRNTWPAKSI